MASRWRLAQAASATIGRLVWSGVACVVGTYDLAAPRALAAVADVNGLAARAFDALAALERDPVRVYLTVGQHRIASAT